MYSDCVAFLCTSMIYLEVICFLPYLQMPFVHTKIGRSEIYQYKNIVNIQQCITDQRCTLDVIKFETVWCCILPQLELKLSIQNIVSVFVYMYMGVLDAGEISCYQLLTFGSLLTSYPLATDMLAIYICNHLT